MHCTCFHKAAGLFDEWVKQTQWRIWYSCQFFFFCCQPVLAIQQTSEVVINYDALVEIDCTNKPPQRPLKAPENVFSKPVFR